MHNHDHCQHNVLKYCAHCDKPYCVDCGKEWNQYQWGYYYRQYPTFPNWLGNTHTTLTTTGGTRLDAQQATNGTVYCTHNEVSK